MTDRATSFAGSPAIRLTEVRKSYGGVAAVRGVSFEVMPGEIHALVGENGAGKSTLIKMMCGIESHDAGTIEIAGEQLAELSAAQALRSGVVAVHQEFNLLPDLTITENITLARPAGFRLRPVDWTERRGASEAALARIHAHTMSLRRLVRDLSVPEQQLVEIAKALASETKVLILDEPSAVLGDHEVAQLFQVLRTLAAEGTAIVYVSHRLREIGEIADRVTVIKDGAHVSTDDAADVSPDELVRRMVGRPLDAQYAEIGSAAGYYDDWQAGRDPAGISTQEPELAARLDPVLGGRRLANYLRTLTLEAQTIARACGKSHVHNLEPEDLVALTIEASAMARVPLAGTSWIPGLTGSF